MTTYIPNIGRIQYQSEERASTMPPRFDTEIYVKGAVSIFARSTEYVNAFYIDKKQVGGHSFNFLVARSYKKDLCLQRSEVVSGRIIKTFIILNNIENN